MNRKSNKMSKIVCAAVTGLMLLGLSMQTASAEPAEQQLLVDKARLTFQSFMGDKDMSWLHENLDQAKGLIIVPSALKGGFILGGSGGRGLLVVKDEKTGQWSQPGFYTLGSVTFGLQIGGEAAEVIMMVRSQKGIDKLLSTSFKLGGDTSVAVGPVGAGAKTSITADILSFARSKGAYAGANFEGAVIKTRDEWNQLYYGKPVRPTDIFVKRSVSNPGSAELRAAVAKAAYAAEQKPRSQAEGQYHVVRSGDTLSKIGKQYDISVDEICRLNNMKKSDTIHPGQKLLVAH
ncbi:MAG: LysM peptidoglycan-binding domain-containing protein [Deltaproteobacteria bacterium]|nr:MAG: LysM peptidoglycan-binding domain-containing protein [Deltaproteobacteria bacterium]